MKKVYILLILISTIVLFFVFKDEKTILKIGEREVSLIIANDTNSRIQGLSDRKSLPKDSAMLFVFETSGRYGIWMKDMNFPIDIIWLDENKKIVTIEENVSPDTYPRSFFPLEESLYVIEANVGFIKENHLSVGNLLNFSEK